MKNSLLAAIITVILCSCGGSGSIKTAEPVKKRAVVSSEIERAYKEALGFMEAKDYVAAVNVFEKIVNTNTLLTGPYINLGIAYTELSDYEKAEEALLKALKLNGFSDIANNRLGLLYRRMGRFSDARMAYERALQNNANYALAHRNLGILCDIYLQDIPCAVKHFEKYKMLNTEENKQIEIWLAEIKRRMPVSHNEINNTTSKEQ